MSEVIDGFKQTFGRTLGSMMTFKQKADATKSQNAPVNGTWYTVLNTTENIRIISIEADGTAGGDGIVIDTLEVKVTIDSETVTFIIASPVSATKYFASLKGDAAPSAQVLETTDRCATGRPFLLEGQSVKIEVRITWTPDGVAPTNVSSRVKYAQRDN